MCIRDSLTGVSQPTVSRVLNGNTSVKPEVREKVLACAREHNFQPNAMARGLVGSGTKLIGVVLTDISNSFFADLEKYMEQAARKKGYSLILFNSDYDREKEKHCLDVMRRYRCLLYTSPWPPGIRSYSLHFHPGASFPALRNNCQRK